MNQWLYLQKLIRPTTKSALVVLVNDDGTSVCTTATGTTITLIGDTVSAGSMCLYDQYGKIIGKASTLAASSAFLPDIDYGLSVYATDETYDYGAITDAVTDCADSYDYGSVA